MPNFSPYWMGLAQLTKLRSLLEEELILQVEQGQNVSHFVEEVQLGDYDDLLELERKLQALPPTEELQRNEPMFWKIPQIDIPQWNPTDEELADKIAGAWNGRIAGCILGKPVEIEQVFWDYRPLHDYLKRSGQYPLRDFIVGDKDAAMEVFYRELGCPKSQKQNIQFAESDDDLRYTFMGVDILDNIGPDYDTKDVCQWWIRNLTPGQLFTAEEAALANLYRLGVHETESFQEQHWAFVQHYRNPYREYIGAAIRADGWAYCAPGNPELAAQFALRDASLSHERNGQYSEIFFAALIAGAFNTAIEYAIEIALSLIPSSCRLARAIRITLDLVGRTDDFEEVCFELHDRFDVLNPVHAINNACACVAGLLLSKGDYEKGITTAVMFGWDTDCNGATVGSVLGANLGLCKLPAEKWFAPFNDRLDLEVRCAPSVKISEIVERTIRVAKRIHTVQAH